MQFLEGPLLEMISIISLGELLQLEFDHLSFPLLLLLFLPLFIYCLLVRFDGLSVILRRSQSETTLHRSVVRDSTLFVRQQLLGLISVHLRTSSL